MPLYQILYRNYQFHITMTLQEVDSLVKVVRMQLTTYIYDVLRYVM
jgi:hypothetical protein